MGWNCYVLLRGSTHILNNYGILKKGFGTNLSEIFVETNNYGTIEVTSGIMEFDGIQGLNNTVDGIIKGIATIDVPVISSFTNEGAFAPGTSSGTLTVLGDFTSTPTSKLEVELEGLNQGIDYDLLEIQGNAIFNGTVEVALGFEPEIGDEFIISTTTGSITSCNLQSFATAQYNGYLYDFIVSCKNNNELVLTVNNKTLGLNSYEMLVKNIHLFPNPTTYNFVIRNDSGQVLLSAEIIDINGRVVKTVSLNNMGKEKEFSVLSYSPGFYFVRIHSDNHTIVKRLVKM